MTLKAASMPFALAFTGVVHLEFHGHTGIYPMTLPSFLLFGIDYHSPTEAAPATSTEHFSTW